MFDQSTHNYISAFELTLNSYVKYLLRLVYSWPNVGPGFNDIFMCFSLTKLPHNISHRINQAIINMGGKPGTYDFISGSAGSASDGDGWSEYSLWLGLAVVGAILVIIVGMVAVRSCMRRRRRARAGRRWREVDRDSGAGGNFYSVASESDTDDNDFEIDVYDKTNKQSSKLLTSYWGRLCTCNPHSLSNSSSEYFVLISKHWACSNHTLEV